MNYSKSQRRAWFANRQWTVETLDRYGSGKWLEIYTTATKAQATADAKKWTKDTGQAARVVPGDGHLSKTDPAAYSKRVANLRHRSKSKHR